MPFKGDENMLVDAKDRAAVGDDDADDNDDQLLGLEQKASGDNGGNDLLSMDLMMGVGTGNTGGGGDMLGDLLGTGMSNPAPMAGGSDLLGAMGAMPMGNAMSME